MKLSVVVNPNGDIVAASIPTHGLGTTPAGGHRGMDQLTLPAGHGSHELSMPADLAKAFLDDKFSEVFHHYVVAHEGGKPTLKKK